MAKPNCLQYRIQYPDHDRWHINVHIRMEHHTYGYKLKQFLDTIFYKSEQSIEDVTFFCSFFACLQDDSHLYISLVIY